MFHDREEYSGYFEGDPPKGSVGRRLRDEVIKPPYMLEFRLLSISFIFYYNLCLTNRADIQTSIYEIIQK